MEYPETMTVGMLIEKLNKIKDKNMPIFIMDSSNGSMYSLNEDIFDHEYVQLEADYICSSEAFQEGEFDGDY